MKKIIALMLAMGVLGSVQNVFADSRIGLCTDLGENYINTEKTLDAVKSTDSDWVRFSPEAWRDCIGADGSFIYPESEKALLKRIGDMGIKRISILGMGVPTNTYFRTQADKNAGIYAQWYDLPVKREGDSYAMEYWNAYLESVEGMVKAQVGLVEAYEVWNEPNHWGFNGYSQKCNKCGKVYRGYNENASKCSCGGTLEGFAVTTAEEYAEIYIAWRDIVKNVYEEQGLEPVPVYCGSVTGWSEDGNGNPEEYFYGYVDAIIEKEGDLSNVDGITLHLYGPANGVWGVDAFAGYKTKLLNTGFNGEILMTETGLYTTSYTDEEQALDVIRRSVMYERFLKDMKDAGLATGGDLLYYELHDGGNDATNAEHNFGIMDFMYEDKQAKKTLTTFNKAVKGKELVAISHDDYTSSNAREIRVAQYEGNGDTAYVIFRYTDRSYLDFDTSVTLTTPGDEIRTYDYLGDLKDVIDQNPSSSKTFSGIKANKPTIVECITYKSVLEWVKFDEVNGTVSFEGNFWNEDSYDKTTCTAEVLDKDGNVIASTVVNVKNDRFSDWISVNAPAGEYTLRIGAPELSDNADEKVFKVTKSGQVTEQSSVIVGATAVYNKTTNSLKVSATVENPANTQKVTVMAVPADADLKTLNADAIGVIKEIELNGGNIFQAEFKIPEWFAGASKVYIGGNGVEEVKSADFNISESDFAYIGELGGKDGVTVSANAALRNFTSKTQKAVLLVSEYDKDGRVLNSHMKNIEIQGKTYSPVNYELNNITPNSNTKSIRAFLWSDLDNKMMPLTEAVNIRN